MPAHRILVADELGEAGLELLRSADGVEVDVRTGQTKKELIAEVGSYHGIIVRSATQIDGDVLADADELIVIGRAGVGVDNIDVEAATLKGVIVMNTPQANAVATAEQTMALMLAASRHTAHAHASLAAHEWARSAFTGIELAGRTLGIIGYGRIGPRGRPARPRVPDGGRGPTTPTSRSWSRATSRSGCSSSTSSSARPTSSLSIARCRLRHATSSTRVRSRCSSPGRS